MAAASVAGAPSRRAASVDRRAALRRSQRRTGGQQYFADGITDDLTTDLSRLRNVLVISRNTAFTYKDQRVDAKQIGRELGVRYVLEGSVRRSGNQVRVNAQLIDAATNTHLWAERFDHDIGDLFAVQNEITSRIANTLGWELIGAETARPTERPDALDYLLRGRAVHGTGGVRENVEKAVDLFERALALDPSSVEAQSRLANALVVRATAQRPCCGNRRPATRRRADRAGSSSLPERRVRAPRQRHFAAHHAAVRGSNSRIRDRARDQSQRSQHPCRPERVQVPDRRLGSRRRSRFSSKPSGSARAIRKWGGGIPGSASCICCNHASTRRSPGSKRREAWIREPGTRISISPPPMA